MAGTRKYTRADVVKYPRVKYRCKIGSFMQNVKSIRFVSLIILARDDNIACNDIYEI